VQKREKKRKRRNLDGPHVKPPPFGVLVVEKLEKEKSKKRKEKFGVYKK
jgi:hypothetical protein